MEARIGAESLQLYAPGTSEMGIRRSGLEWDLNDWKWDGDLFVATPLKAVQSDCRSKQLFPANGGLLSCAGEADVGLSSRGRDELEKRRRVSVLEEDDGGGRAGLNSLALKLGSAYPVSEAGDFANGDANSSKRSKIQAGNANRGMCQVEGCGADLGEAKDYHRRHKVCEMHAKASTAIVANSVQRFCQQCSRFHLIQEFDEGKRSCRRRLAGHNKRRRKTHPDTVGNEASLSNDQASSYLLISLLRILSNVQSSGNGEAKYQDLLCHLLKNLANPAGSLEPGNLAALLQASQDKHKGNSAAPSPDSAQAIISRCFTGNELHKSHESQGVPESNGRVNNVALCPVVSSVEIPREVSCMHYCPETSVQRDKPKAEQSGVKNFDLNDVYQDELDGMEEPELVEISKSPGTGSPSYPMWLLQDSHHSSPPQTSGQSNSLSSDSRVSSNGDAQSRTDRIVFKLFGKDPTDFPLELRNQILGWLSSTPSDVESYIRPGCVILTLYLRLSDSMWKELSHDLSSGLRKLLNLASNEFWQMGWIYVRVQHQMAFIYNGQLLLDAPLVQNCRSQCRIWSISPLAVSISGRIKFTVKGYNIIRSTMRLFCSFEGKYLVDEATQSLNSDTTVINQYDSPQCLSFSCSVPSTSGRGFIEVEDQGLSSVFFPFIVAETEICTEICTLESTIDLAWSVNNLEEESAAMKSRARALHFLDEMGWLLRRLQLISRVENRDSKIFSFTRLWWLLEFAIERDWCAIIRKLLDLLVGGFIDTGGCPVERALSEISLLHVAVRNNSRSVVELLVRYIPDKSLRAGKSEVRALYAECLFSPDMVTALGVTPLHIAASRGDSLGVLDALTNDPKQVGITVWKSALDASGFTPEDYARSRGFNSYLQLVEKKIRERSNPSHIILDISTGNSASSHMVPEETDTSGTTKQTGLEIDTMASRPVHLSHCKICSHQELAYINRSRSSLLYRPAMLAMVGIAAVCVCVGLLLKGPPNVVYVFPPFRWEMLEFGPM